MSAASWCKVASNLDSHPKIRRAGRNGREVFLFALRRNAEPGIQVAGLLPAITLEPWYLADQLMMSEAEAADGVARCELAGLLIRDGQSWRIGGWCDDEWGRPFTGAERTETWRKRRATAPVTQPSPVTVGDADVTVPTSHVTAGDGCDGREEKRREEKRERESGKPDVLASSGSRPADPCACPDPGAVTDPVAELATVAVAEINRLASTSHLPTTAKTVEHCKALIRNRYTPDDAVAVIRSKRSWISDERMHVQFTPSVLLKPKNFAGYLDEIRAKKPRSRKPVPDDTPPLVGFAESAGAP